MKLYENSKKPSNRSSNRCGYCREHGHNRLECPHVAEDWKHWQHFRVPPRKQGWYRTRQQPKYWGEWYSDCMATIIKQEEKQKKQKISATVVRAAPKCGFCGSEGHNRRNCAQMKSFVELCKKANANYRRDFYNTVVKGLGLDVGAAIEVRNDGYHSDPNNPTAIGLVTSVNMDTVNVFTAFDGDWDTKDKYGQPLNVAALVEDSEVWVNVKSFICSETHNWNGIVVCADTHWSRYKLTKVIGKSEAPLSDDWVESYEEAWEYLAKNRSYERLISDGVVAHVEKWANK